jgi:hypothetical protein
MTLYRGAAQTGDSTTRMHSVTKAASYCFRLARRIGRRLGCFAISELGYRGSGESNWCTVLEEVARKLDELNRSTEQDFLVVGGKLMEFLSVARQISSDMTELTALISGDQSHNSSQALSRMLERARSMDTRLTQNGQALKNLHDLARRVQFSFSKLAETVALFRALCTLTRIETSRLGIDGSDFSNLADEVKPLSERIGLTGQGILEEAARLEQSIDSALRTSAQISSQELQELQSLIAHVVESLKFFEERQQRAREASARQAAQFSSVLEGIEDLVGSIQFHDITRQQIEHVCQALRELCSHISLEGENPEVPPPEACPALTLQRSQLSSSAQVFAAAIERVNSDLEGIDAQVNEMANASATLVGFSEGERESFFLRMENCFTGILQTAGNCAAEETALRTTASQLERSVGSMRKAVDGIRGIEIQIQRIAINASIRSAHLKDSGHALNVLADVMLRVAFESNQKTEQAAAALDSMSRTLQHTSVSDENRTVEGASDSDDVAGEMRDAILKLHAASERSVARVMQIAGMNASLRDDIRSVRESLSVGPLFAQVVAGALDDLHRMADEASRGASRNIDPASAQNLDRFAIRYTMQAEREVHESMTQSSATSNAASLEAPRIRLAESDLGDNVELF